MHTSADGTLQVPGAVPAAVKRPPIPQGEPRILEVPVAEPCEVPVLKAPDVSGMTFTELLEQLTESEKAKFAAERKVEADVRRADAKVRALTQRLAEMRRKHEQEQRELQAKCAKQARDSSQLSRQVVRAAENARTMAEGECAAAQCVMEHAESNVKNLAAKVSDLRKQLQAKNVEAQKVIARREREADERLGRVDAQSSQRVNDATQLCKEVQEAAASSLDIMAGEHLEQHTRADMRAEGRHRFRELCALSKMRAELEVSQEEYETAKNDLIELWQTQRSVFTEKTRPLELTGSHFKFSGPIAEDFQVGTPSLSPCTADAASLISQVCLEASRSDTEDTAFNATVKKS